MPSNAVKGIGFDATCSLAVMDAEGNPLSVSPTGNVSYVRIFSEYQHWLKIVFLYETSFYLFFTFVHQFL